MTHRRPLQIAQYAHVSNQMPELTNVSKLEIWQAVVRSACHWSRKNVLAGLSNSFVSVYFVLHIFILTWFKEANNGESTRVNYLMLCHLTVVRFLINFYFWTVSMTFKKPRQDPKKLYTFIHILILDYTLCFYFFGNNFVFFCNKFVRGSKFNCNVEFWILLCWIFVHIKW